MARSNPHDWRVPVWHPDWGDPGRELEMLRAFALQLLAARPDLDVRLDALEPGCMRLAISREEGELAELYVVEGEREAAGLRYALFAGEDEFYSRSPTEVIARLLAQLSGQ